MVAQNPIRNHSTNHTRRRIARKPERMARYMLMRRIPHSRDKRKARTDRTLKHTEKEAKNHETSVIMCNSVKSKNNAPDEHENAQIFAEREFDEAEGDGVRSYEVAYVENTRRPAELLADELLCLLVGVCLDYGDYVPDPLLGQE